MVRDGNSCSALIVSNAATFESQGMCDGILSCLCFMDRLRWLKRFSVISTFPNVSNKDYSSLLICRNYNRSWGKLGWKWPLLRRWCVAYDITHGVYVKPCRNIIFDLLPVPQGYPDIAYSFDVFYAKVNHNCVSFMSRIEYELVHSIELVLCFQSFASFAYLTLRWTFQV
jgi:hypothetical protein